MTQRPNSMDSIPENLTLRIEAINHHAAKQKIMPKRDNIVVFSGGSAANTLVDVFDNVAKEKGCTLS